MTKSIRVVGIAGSLSKISTTAAVVSQALADLPCGIDTKMIALTDISPDAMLSANPSDPSLRAAIETVAAADGVILGTPIYKASLSGLLKAFIDHLPQYGMAGKTVWPIGTGGSLAHALALDYGVRPIVQSMGARQIIQSVFLAPEELTVSNPRDLASHLNANLRYVEAIRHFEIALHNPAPIEMLGHPVPQRTSHQERTFA